MQNYMTYFDVLIDKWYCNISYLMCGRSPDNYYKLTEKKNKLDYIIINSAEPTHSKSQINVGAVYQI